MPSSVTVTGDESHTSAEFRPQSSELRGEGCRLRHSVSASPTAVVRELYG